MLRWRSIREAFIFIWFVLFARSSSSLEDIGSILHQDFQVDAETVPGRGVRWKNGVSFYRFSKMSIFGFHGADALDATFLLKCEIDTGYI